ncbi:MAG: MFS transporter [Gammaproteobacteria bacterium]|nr:MFS transporter [Gammaproteobacteria bacterium]
MVNVLLQVWSLLTGIVLIMLGNGMHSTLIGLRGSIEGFSSAELAVITSGYFIGYLSGARLSPLMIKRVGHVRVFAALGSFTSAGLIAFPLITEPWAWTVLRIMLGFCMSGVYVVAESWLNEASTNESRGKVLSAYMIAQTLGIIGAQGLLMLGDASTSVLFIGASILVSISFAPILLSASPVPASELVRPMRLRDLYASSHLGTVGIFLLGGIYASQIGMAAVYGTQIGLSSSNIALFVATFFAGALALQYPIGWLSDHMDRRKLIFAVCCVGTVSSIYGWTTNGSYWPLLIAAFITGGATSPLYALFLAYTNDSLDTKDMAAASGGLVFTFGLGAIFGPLIAGWAMEGVGAFAFWLVMAMVFAIVAMYSVYCMTQRKRTLVEETESYLGVIPSSSYVAVEAAGTWSSEHAEEEREAEENNT